MLIELIRFNNTIMFTVLFNKLTKQEQSDFYEYVDPTPEYMIINMSTEEFKDIACKYNNTDDLAYKLWVDELSKDKVTAYIQEVDLVINASSI